MTLGTDINVFLLLDGAKLSAPCITYQHDDAPWADWLYRGTRHETALDVSPYLVMPSVDSRLWEQQPVWADAGIVLKARAMPETVIEHLRSLISVRMPSGQLGYCRFYANTQLHRFLGVLTESERNQFSGPIAEWQNLSAKAAGQSVKTSGGAESKTSKDEGWFQLNETHTRAMNGAQTELFLGKLVRHLGFDTGSESLGRAERLAQQAQAQGFRFEQEIARYAELALRHEQALDSDASRLHSQSRRHPQSHCPQAWGQCHPADEPESGN